MPSIHLLGALVLLLVPCSAAKRPNVLLLLADDQRADTIAALGNPAIHSPNLDRLARGGLAFDRAYMQGAFHGATCVPSRAMLLSGQSLFRVDEKLLRDPTWPAAFGAAGYATFLTGKWHNGAAAVPVSFQAARGVFLGGMTDPLRAPLVDLEGGRFTAPRVQAGKHACATFADEAIRFLAQSRDEPFFCYVAFDAPHDPHIVPDDFATRYDPASIPLPPNFLPDHPWDYGERKVRDEQLLPKPLQADAVRSMLSDYWRYVSYLDAQVGRILDALAASPHAADTIVVYAADSGVARGSHGLIGKQNLYEHSVRVPLIVAGPGIPAGKRTRALCLLQDLLPTLGARCRVEPPRGSTGLDLGAVLADPDRAGRPQLVLAYRDFQRAVITPSSKCIVYPKADRTQLFDLASDPAETRNLAEEPTHAAERKKLETLLAESLAEAGDRPPSSNNAPR